MRMKRWMSLLFCLLLCTSLLPVHTMAGSTIYRMEDTMLEPAKTSIAAFQRKKSILGDARGFTNDGEERDGRDPEELFEGFVKQQMGRHPSAESEKTAYDRLTGLTKDVYRCLVPEIHKVAIGQRSSTIFEFSMNTLGYGDFIRWTAEELGVDSVIKDGYADEAVDEFWDKFRELFDFSMLGDALNFDVAFDLYWGYMYGYSVNTDIHKNGEWIDITGIKAHFGVYPEYQDGDGNMNTAIGQSVVTAGNNARSIVAKYKDASDYEKLRGYSKEICDLVKYNYDAYNNAENGYVCDRSAIEALYVFDGDPTTNVVCTGYAKAFQHLCNLTKFNSKTIQCNTVSGDAGGAHAWNVVQMDDGKNYLVDVTWADGGWGDKYLLKEAEEGTYPRYKFNGKWREYDGETMDLYGEKKLTISNQKYVPLGLSIEGQPKDVKVKSGSKAKFTVKVKQKNVTYQWYSRPSAKDKWTAINGATNTALTVVATGANNGWQYRCCVKNSREELYSDMATLTVTLQKPVIKTPPKSLAVVSGKKAKFTVKASGPKLTYTWYSRPNAEGEWTSIAGQTKKDLSIVASKANDGSQYYCHIQNADGEADTAVVTLTVTPQPPTIKTQPKDAKVKIGAKAKFKVKASGKNVTYQWYYRTSETGEWVLLDGATAATYTVIATEGNIGWQFRCLAKNADGQAYSKPATLRQK